MLNCLLLCWCHHPGESNHWIFRSTTFLPCRKTKSVVEFFNFIYLFSSNFLLLLLLSIAWVHRDRDGRSLDWIVERGAKEVETAKKLFKLGLMFNYLDRIEISEGKRGRRTKYLKAFNSIAKTLAFPRRKLHYLGALLTPQTDPPDSIPFWQSTHFHLNICSITHRERREQQKLFNELENSQRTEICI